MNRLFINAVFIIFIFSELILSQSHPDTSIVFYNTCPFECCQFGKWIINDPVDVYKNEGDTSSISFTLAVKDTVIAKTGNLHFIQVGKVVVLEKIYDFQPDDTLTAFNCTEGEFLVVHNNKEYYVDVFWPMFFYDNEDNLENYLNEIEKYKYYGRMIQRPESVWWVKIISAKGEGWIRLKNKTPYCFSIDEEIKGMDGCG